MSAEFLDDETAELTFEKPIRALTPGQICAFYEGNTLLGGGVFQEIHYEDSAVPAVATSDRD